MIDLVITSVFPRKKWVEQRNYYKSLESGVALKSEDANGECRYRDFNLLRFWFRSIEKNCNWYNKIFLVLQDEDQIPSWLNLDNPKLKVVYHRDFIPEELLPTFNTNTIELHLHKIPGLSEQFIYFNDDVFILNKVNENKFFKDGLPIYNYKVKDAKTRKPTTIWLRSLCNNKVIEDKYKPVNTVFVDAHMTRPLLKSYMTKIYDENKEIYKSLVASKFRHETNCTNYVYSDIMQLMGKTFTDANIFSNCKNISLNDKTSDFDSFFKLDIACLNDNYNLSDNKYKFVKKNLISAFLKRFPNKSSFEKEDKFYVLKGLYENDISLDNQYNNILISDIVQPNISKDVLVLRDLQNINYTEVMYYLWEPRF